MSHRIHAQMASAMETVRKILELTRNPRYAENEDHTYDDKFGLAEFVVNSAMAAQINALERLGLDETKLKQLLKHVHDEQRSVTLRFDASESCEFVKETKVELEGPEYHVFTQESEKERGIFKSKEKTSKHKVVTKVTEYHWRVGVSYKLFVFVGNDFENQVVLQNRDAFTTVITTGNKEEPPLKRNRRASKTPIDFSLTWLLQNLLLKEEDSPVCHFGIDRSIESCRTPRRNEQVDGALEYFRQVQSWARDVCNYFCVNVERNILAFHKPASKTEGEAQYSPLDTIQADTIFVPVFPLMEASKEEESNEDDPQDATTDAIVSFPSGNSESPLLSVGDVNLFLEEQRRSLEEASTNLTLARPSDQEKSTLLSVAEAKIVLLGRHLEAISARTNESVVYIEDMLRSQLIAAISKQVDPQDFEEYMRSHNQKLLGPAYAPRPFCYAIRRPNHYPDGILGIEAKSTTDDKVEPVETIVQEISGTTTPPMYIPLNAATTIEFTGERYLHAWIQHRFASSRRPQPVLTARARQFSSFLLMIGNLAGPDKFLPKDAIIVQNKDEVMIPLLLNELPTPKEFKDAIASLSPEQQRFAKSFRGMQLESSVFGVCVVQLKPQLEALLGLPQDALTKEIGLTQDLLSLFIDYQIPSDLLSFDGSHELAVGEKVETVKTYVSRVQTVIDGAKTKQLEEQVQKADMQAEMDSYGGADPRYQDRGGRPQYEAFMCSAAPPPDIPRGGRPHVERRSGGGNTFTASAAPPPPPGGFGGGAAMTLFGSAPAPPPPPVKAAFRASAAPPPPGGFGGGAAMTPFGSASFQRQAAAAPPAPPVKAAGMKSMSVAAAPRAEMQERRMITASDKVMDTVASATPTGLEDFATPGVVEGGQQVDFTGIPKQLNAAFDKHDTDNALRTTIIKTGDNWRRSRQENLLTEMVEKGLAKPDQKSEKNKAFDLLDALSRSGSLPIACAELHVVLGVTHCFENTVMGTVIEDNMNPIEKMEKSTLLIASVIHNKPTDALVQGSKAESARLSSEYPPTALLEGGESKDNESVNV